VSIEVRIVRKRRIHRLSFQLVTLVLVEAQTVLALPVPRPEVQSLEKRTDEPVDALELLRVTAGTRARAVTVKRRKPAPLVVSRFPSFSEIPTESEIFRAGVFPEPLIPVGGESTPGERRALANALLDYLHGGGGERVKPLLDFLSAHPGSVYEAALWFDIGAVYRRSGYFSRALEAWERAWALSRDETEAKASLLGDGAVGELAALNARLGRVERLEELFREIEGRNVRGSAAEKVSGAAGGLWLMRDRPEDAFRCGPFALDRILAHQDPAYRRPEAISSSRSTSRGLPLSAVRELATEVGLRYQMAKREGKDSAFVVPSVVHWRSDHYAALLEERDGRFLIEDLTFDDHLWVSREALTDEASGYFLVGEGTLPVGWRPVDEAEGNRVWGKGHTERQNPQEQQNLRPARR
jgi:hypothetical protein